MMQGLRVIHWLISFIKVVASMIVALDIYHQLERHRLYTIQSMQRQSSPLFYTFHPSEQSEGVWLVQTQPFPDFFYT